MGEWPALMVAADMIRSTTNLNGRRWSGTALIEAWAGYLEHQPLHLACGDPNLPNQLSEALSNAGHQGERFVHGLVHPEDYADLGGLFIPDPSLGRWSRWRQRCGHNQFSLIGQIHTLSTPGAANYIEGLITEPVQPWDALICSSRAGRDVVCSILDDREAWIQRRFGTQNNISRPQLPVIPLPVAVKSLQRALPTCTQARASLGIPADAAVCLWLGRLSILTKMDPWTQYRVLNQVGQQLPNDLWLIECGPDDSDEQSNHFEKLRHLCPDVNFLRLGGHEAVTESVKHQALAAANAAISLVDNCQETFGLSVVEAMAAGLPMVVSDWNGYKDLVRDGVDGFRVPSRWISGADAASVGLAWAQEIGLQSYPGISGALAQMVALDAEAATSMLTALLLDTSLAKAMGRQGMQHVAKQCEFKQVMSQYDKLFKEINELRKRAPQDGAPHSPPITLNPVKLFRHYPSQHRQSDRWTQARHAEIPAPVSAFRQQLWYEAMRACRDEHARRKLNQSLREKHL